MTCIRKTGFIAVAATLFAWVNLAQAETPTSNYEHLKEYGSAIVGEWVQESAADFEFQDIVKKGDTITVRVVNKWMLNKNAISTQWTAQVNGVKVASGHGMTGWDRSAGRIVSSGFNSLGGHGHGITEKRDGKWYDSGMGVGPLGHVGAGTSITTIVNDDKHEILEIGRLNSTGEPLPNRTLTIKRAKK